MTLQNNEKSLIVATGFGTDDNPFPLTGLQVIWTSDHSELADLVVAEDSHSAEFVPKPLSQGTVVVTGSVTSGSSTFTNTVTFTVLLTPASLAGITLTAQAPVLQ